LRLLLPGGSFGRVPSKRSKAMGAVKGKGNKTTERRLRAALARAGVSGWKLHPRGVQGNPDFYFPNLPLAIFVDGCFWHGCPRCSHGLRINSSFWKAKLTRNRERDRQTNAKLVRIGIRVLRLWEHDLASDLSACVERVRAACRGGRPGSVRRGRSTGT
jgi:DNA mismatch endonuclease, patch repair protein